MTKRTLNFNLITLAALGLMVISLFLPNLLEQWRFNIVNSLQDSIWLADKGLLMLVAAQVVLYNTLLMLPILSGGLFMVQAFTRKGSTKLVRYGIPLFLGIIFYYVIFKQLDYALPTAVPILAIILAGALGWRSRLGKTGFFPEVLISVLVVLTVNTLSIVPYVGDYGFARGDLTWETILAGRFLNSEDLLNIAGISLFILLLGVAWGAAELIALYQRQLRDAEELRRYELEYQSAQSQIQEARVIQEMHTLVHDLKTPLMTVQGLNSLLQMAVQDERIQGYTGRIEKAVDNLNKMISEILYDEVRKEVTVEELINYLQPYVLVKAGSQDLVFDVGQALPPLEANLIRLSRAFINLIDNALTATSGIRNARIEIKVRSNILNEVVFIISDNGVGIPYDVLDNIWTTGFSTKSSAGLGLGFVKGVIENHHGSITLESQPGQGTKVTVVIPGVKSND